MSIRRGLRLPALAVLTLLLSFGCSVQLSEGIGRSQRDVVLFLADYGRVQREHYEREGKFDPNLWRLPSFDSAALRTLAFN